MMSNFTGTVLLTIFLVALAALVISPVRFVLTHFLTAFLSPMLKEILKALALWSWAFTKGIWTQHWILMKNLVTPRKVLYKSLVDSQDEK